MSSVRVGLVALVAWAVSAVAFGQAGTGFTISHGDVFFSQPNSPTSGTVTGVSGGNFRLNGAAGTDHLFENWWWYRVDGVDNREFALNSSSGTTASGNTATTNWTLPMFTASLRYTVTDLGVNQGIVTESLLVTNTGPAPIVLNLFNYVDFDVNGTAGTDNAALFAPNHMTIADGPWTMNYLGPNASAYQVTSFATLRGLLTNTAVNNLNNTGLPFGPGDFTGGFQWRIPLDPGHSAIVTEILGVPEPASLALLGLGGLFLRRRR